MQPPDEEPDDGPGGDASPRAGLVGKAGKVRDHDLAANIEEKVRETRMAASRVMQFAIHQERLKQEEDLTELQEQLDAGVITEARAPGRTRAPCCMGCLGRFFVAPSSRPPTPGPCRRPGRPAPARATYRAREAAHEPSPAPSTARDCTGPRAVRKRPCRATGAQGRSGEAPAPRRRAPSGSSGRTTPALYRPGAGQSAPATCGAFAVTCVVVARRLPLGTSR